MEISFPLPTVTTEMDNLGVILEWQAMNGIADTTIELMIFTPQTGGTQTVVFSGKFLLTVITNSVSCKGTGFRLCHGFDYD